MQGIGRSVKGRQGVAPIRTGCQADMSAFALVERGQHASENDAGQDASSATTLNDPRMTATGIHNSQGPRERKAHPPCFPRGPTGPRAVPGDHWAGEGF